MKYGVTTQRACAIVELLRASPGRTAAQVGTAVGLAGATYQVKELLRELIEHGRVARVNLKSGVRNGIGRGPFHYFLENDGTVPAPLDDEADSWRPDIRRRCASLTQPPVDELAERSRFGVYPAWLCVPAASGRWYDARA